MKSKSTNLEMLMKFQNLRKNVQIFYFLEKPPPILPKNYPNPEPPPQKKKKNSSGGRRVTKLPNPSQPNPTLPTCCLTNLLNLPHLGKTFSFCQQGTLGSKPENAPMAQLSKNSRDGTHPNRNHQAFLRGRVIYIYNRYIYIYNIYIYIIYIYIYLFFFEVKVSQSEKFS